MIDEGSRPSSARAEIVGSIPGRSREIDPGSSPMAGGPGPPHIRLPSTDRIGPGMLPRGRASATPKPGRSPLDIVARFSSIGTSRGRAPGGGTAMPFKQSDAIEVKRIKGKGRGVFARRPIREGAVIESVPVLVMTAEEYARGVAGTVLENYCFGWDPDKVALALGYGSLYNHSYRPNARYEDVGPSTKRFIALRDIGPGEEITVNYNGKPKSRSKVWFDLVDEPGPGGGPG